MLFILVNLKAQLCVKMPSRFTFICFQQSYLGYKLTNSVHVCAATSVKCVCVCKFMRFLMFWKV